MQPSTSAAHKLSTLRRRGERFSLNVNPREGMEVDDSLNELLHVTWTAFGVSVLFNFHRDQVHLKQYAKRLREEVAQGMAQENVVYNAEFHIMQDVTSNSLDSEPIKIEVHSKANGTTEGPEKCIYRGILLSWKNHRQKLLTSDTVRFPLLLCRGAKGATRIVHHVLCRIFDCFIVALPIGEEDLMWLISIAIFPTDENEYPKNTDEIRMEYRIPELPDTDTITINFPALELTKVLKVIVEADQNDTDTEVTLSLNHVEKFHQVLCTETLSMCSLQMRLCTLHKVNLPGLVIIGNMMKVTKTDTMNRILSYMNNKALDTLHAVNTGNLAPAV